MPTTPDLQALINKKNEQMAAMMPQEVKKLLQQKAEELASQKIESNAIGLGDQAPDFSLPNVHGSPVSLAQLLVKGPLVLSFYRGAWCPYCNLEIRALNAFKGRFKTFGAQLVAISPQLPERSAKLAEEAALDFEVLSDVGNLVARTYGLTYRLDPALREVYLSFGLDVPGHNGDQTWELPFPATYLIDRQGKVRFAFVEPDYRKRTEPAKLLEVLQTLDQEAGL
ncbi:MAG: hypothetical protein A2600_05865 [Candidatus Lambdaproteobacteria bacterium RIFOXYD1_FULL_56_27]|uniref:thioredoxin-dependent peroxiredoxin n=1 Tax=Candidatus Lambdaproteobacteria bacterium RIFOXYD2_FULL_56_26 TaxID=1817773 RepID=A0A1F6GP41_9PROT|nr:MAG: hypothetical protein A2557_01470 [Candidatus Lambdaproteobacteria bacterium RIFOXYD2_FULL_56_26]OGH04080.1 MAG: hypothetical protein A2426_01515 [Candidatus Lambdaproteobacteria bacterium RIFOXYC1_FULL_56_13]OGH09810.1 MAG: hypothetical protein A2600_05865 [Candidatus Lambdaproteobacteria bacterium RIFOXYD1_FULL_56_27]